MGEFSKSLDYSEKCLALDGENLKAKVRKAMAMAELDKDLELAYEILYDMAKNDTKNKSIRQYLEKIKVKLAEIKAKDRAREKQFGAAFAKTMMGEDGGERVKEEENEGAVKEA